MKARHFRALTSSTVVRQLIRLTVALCLIATPLLAQSGSQVAQPQIAVVAPQLSQLNVATLQASGLPGTFTWHYGTIVGIGYSLPLADVRSLLYGTWEVPHGNSAESPMHSGKFSKLLFPAPAASHF
jgi:hypothetical protein